MKRYRPDYSSLGPCMQEDVAGNFVKLTDSQERIAALEAQLTELTIESEGTIGALRAENAELRRIKEAADVLYSEAEEYHFDIAALEAQLTELTIESEGTIGALKDEIAKVKIMLFRVYDYVGVPDDRHSIWGPVRAYLKAREGK